MMRLRLRLCAALFIVVASRWHLSAAEVPDDFPRFVVPGKKAETDSLRQLFWLHYQPAGPLIPLWDEWLPNATLWPARGEDEGLNAIRRRWTNALASRKFDAEGYVLTEQHDGPAHAEGWPFPFWSHAGGVGWHFRPIGVAGYDMPLSSPEGWQLHGAEGTEVDDYGWRISLNEPRAAIASPRFSMNAALLPWVRINWWATGLTGAKPYLEWTTADEPEFGGDRRMALPLEQDAISPAPLTTGEAQKAAAAARETRTMIPVYRSPAWKGTITQFRLSFDNPGPATVVFKSIHTACDTRHNVNNLNFIRGCHDYFLWTRDVDFLRGQMARIRDAMRFIEREFKTREKKCIFTTWPGHEGRSGVRRHGGVKEIVPGQGIGSNYWDLLPFGGEDALATIYYYDALLDLAELEEAVAQHAGWSIPSDGKLYDPADLRRHAQEVKAYGGKRFWNAETGRFGTRDLDGELHDYGFTFLNNEAVYYDFATPEQAASIHAWISGQRTVAGDTSTGADIYHWRFGPRSTTRRNIEYYVWTWSSPESIPFGNQVQDGGAVLGWSYHDLMARLKTAGPDDAAARLTEIARWFQETQEERGYRAYYAKDPARGTLQGGNVAGGLGLDREFFESVLVPQAMLYGFLGFRPTVDGFAIDPKLPADWPSLTVTRIHLHDWVLDITAKRGKTVSVTGSGHENEQLVVHAAENVKVSSPEQILLKIVRQGQP
jgi:hypothetical protein